MLHNAGIPDDSLQIFVSSVMTDENLSAERGVVRDAIRGLRLTRPWLFEKGPAEPVPVGDAYLREVRESDLLVLIVSRTHMRAVQNEIETADAAGVHILAFVRGQANSDGRATVLSWLRSRVRYREFDSESELFEEVQRAISVELVRGYRRYRLAKADITTLRPLVETPPAAHVRLATADDADDVRAILEELRTWYPKIDDWIEKVIIEDRLGGVRLVSWDQRLAGISISRDKDDRVRKLSTLYLRPEFRGESIGPYLVYEEVRRTAKEGFEKAYVTFAAELEAALGPILARYGFVAEGVSAGRYRANRAEFVMGKTFVNGVVAADSFRAFVKGNLVDAFGGETVAEDGTGFEVVLGHAPLWGVPVAGQRFRLEISSSPEPEVVFERLVAQPPNLPWCFVSLYGKPAEAGHWSHNRKDWIDGSDLKRFFYPVVLDRPEQRGLICTIEPRFADALFPRSEQLPMLDPSRFQVRPDNVYYRSPSAYRGLRRGAPIFFYVSAPEMAIRGNATLSEYFVGSPDDCFERYGSKGVLTTADLDLIGENGRGRSLALAFDWYREQRQPLSRVRDVVNGYNPQAARRIAFHQARRLSE